MSAPIPRIGYCVQFLSGGVGIAFQSILLSLGANVWLAMGLCQFFIWMGWYVHHNMYRVGRCGCEQRGETVRRVRSATGSR